MSKYEALRLALEALELHGKQYPHMVKGYCLDAITALRQALSEEQESVALETVYETIIHWDENGGKRSRRELARRIVDLYSTPPQHIWVSLTDEEIIKRANNEVFAEAFARGVAWAEAKLKDKNND